MRALRAGGLVLAGAMAGSWAAERVLTDELRASARRSAYWRDDVGGAAERLDIAAQRLTELAEPAGTGIRNGQETTIRWHVPGDAMERLERARSYYHRTIYSAKRPSGARHAST